MVGREAFWKLAWWEKGKHIRGKVMPLFGQALLRVSKKGSTLTNSRSVVRGRRRSGEWEQIIDLMAGSMPSGASETLFV